MSFKIYFWCLRFFSQKNPEDVSVEHEERFYHDISSNKQCFHHDMTDSQSGIQRPQLYKGHLFFILIFFITQNFVRQCYLYVFANMLNFFSGKVVGFNFGAVGETKHQSEAFFISSW